ncbi:conserved hypothetical protein [Shewanella frigidimarina NCIMB 400]|uniref:DUF2835 domain-containing protein n=2 Tax=Shewanellaceae TaxID=267890 RepID=Q081J3_SHEFN|nr:conserved hypothetical protein [Shewanella frigidimarina NCIMB 400]|tara:strand:- start:1554 stop:1772 length:219 start_codon:yes stop_codon:yes gene_type:complete
MMEFLFSLNVSYEAFLPYYQGLAEKVQVRDHQGRVLHINGKYFRPYLTPQGIHGQFKLVLNREGNFKSLNKL